MTNFTTTKCYFMILDNDKLPSRIIFSDILVVTISCIFSVIATSANGMVLAIIWRTPSLKTPSYAVLCCLALSDFFVGLIVQPLVIAVKVGAILGSFSCTLWTIKEAISWTLSAVSFLTMVLVSVERYLALHLHLKYVQLVTIQSICLTYVSFYPFSLFVVSLWLAGVSEKNMGILVVAMVIACLSIIFAIQHKILKLVRRHQRQIQEQFNLVNQASDQKYSSLNIKQYKRSTSTVMLVVFLSVVLYIPFICTKAVLSIKGFTKHVNYAYDLTWCFVYINSSVNPCIYCLRMNEIKQVFLLNLRKYAPWK